ncbi:acyl-CoA oxidase [Peniophora sp. CONT]|nr:acyl-CoA oxidase [Peniophora sp. CONT]
MSDQQARDLSAARAASGLDVRALGLFVHGDSDTLDSRTRISQTLARDPLFAGPAPVSRPDVYARSMAQMNRLYDLQETNGWTEHDVEAAMGMLGEGTGMTLHHSAFVPVFLAQASPELLKQFGTLVRTRGVIGCYLQTELAHGSNVGGLQTTATYLSESDEFELNTPTPGARKWWIGALGRTATHGVLQAQLILKGKSYGPHLFFVQLRDTETHAPLPGVTIGDIGPKVHNAWRATDNGFASFEKVRVPRTWMLSRYAQVTRTGDYVRPPHAKIAYGGMMYLRAGFTATAGWTLAKAITIAIRYATIRRQGALDPTSVDPSVSIPGAPVLEMPVLRYPSTYARLLPVLARAYVLIGLGRSVIATFKAFSESLANGDTSALGEMHALTSALKVYATNTAVRDIEVARQSMGGHGFSAAGGIGRIWAQYLPSVTFEGDNFVLDHQVVRAAVKAHARVSQADFKSQPSSLSPSSAYLRLLSASPPTFGSIEDWGDVRKLAMLLEMRAARVVAARASSDDDVHDPGAAARVSNAVAAAFVGVQVADMADGLDSSGLGKREQVAITRLYVLFLQSDLESGLGDLYQFGLLQGEDTGRTLRRALGRTCMDLLPDAVVLVDAFAFQDWELNSALGAADGRAYARLIERAEEDEMNVDEEHARMVFEESIRPILERGRRMAVKELAAKTKL